MSWREALRRPPSLRTVVSHFFQKRKPLISKDFGPKNDLPSNATDACVGSFAITAYLRFAYDEMLPRLLLNLGRNGRS